jgi:hypothetical protein
MIIVLAGCIGRFPVGGHAWAEMQYLQGLRSLGHEVFYLEDTGESSWVYRWDVEEVTAELDYPTAYVRDCLEPIGLEDRWIYRAGNHSLGMSVDQFAEVCSRADLLLVRGLSLPHWRAEYDCPRRRAFVDVDPGFTQFRLAEGDSSLRDVVARCERLFTIAQRLGAADCPIPTLERRWLKTVTPVWLPGWPLRAGGDGEAFTTIMQWKSYGEVIHQGVRYGNKDREFPKFFDLPQRTGQRFRIATTDGSRQLSQHGWEVIPGWAASETPQVYQAFIRQSRAEFAVAKHGYVASRGGWFSDRSVCYLASGRPVLVQDTGLSDWLPVNDGIVCFSDPDEAARGVEAINAAYERHARAARHIAEEYFDSEQVLSALLAAAME